MDGDFNDFMAVLLVEDRCLYLSSRVCTRIQYKEMKCTTFLFFIETMDIHCTRWVLPRSCVLLYHQNAFIPDSRRFERCFVKVVCDVQKHFIERKIIIY